MELSLEGAPQTQEKASLTQQQVDDAEHFKRMAKGFAPFIKAAQRHMVRDDLDHQSMVQDSFDELSRIWADALHLCGNREPEMAEALEELSRLRDEHRELLA